jgi:hypothetical protein
MILFYIFYIYLSLFDISLLFYFFYITDLQFSSEDEFDEVPFGADEHSEQNEMETLELSEVREESVVLADDDSQQAAEAMVQLGNVGFYVGEQQLLQQGKRARTQKNNKYN